jgi:pyruvyltransferase
MRRDPGLYHWSPSASEENFGDRLSPVIVSRILGREVRRAGAEEGPKLLAIGSILHFAAAGDTIWGSGVNGKCLEDTYYQFDSLDVRAVRGPLTREFLIRRGIACPEIFGDPALLLSHLYPEFVPSGEEEYGLVPHLHDRQLLKDQPRQIHPTEPWRTIIAKILRCRLVISSSLHGIIAAESLGIPARLLKVSMTEPYFKYEDYYLGSGRATFRAARSVEEARTLGGEPPPTFNARELLGAFPRAIFV